MIPPTTRRLDVYGTELAVAWDGVGWGRLRRGRTKILRPYEPKGFAFTDSFNHGPRNSHHVFFSINLAKHAGNEAELLNTITHEAFHGAISIGDTHGLGHPVYQQEPYAYLVGWLTQWIWEARPREWKVEGKQPAPAAPGELGRPDEDRSRALRDALRVPASQEREALPSVR